MLSRRLLTLLASIDDAAQKAGVPCTEPARQAALIAEAPAGSVPTSADVNSVRAQHAALWTRSRERPLGDGSR